MINKSQFSYIGTVTLSSKINGKVVEFERHNAGTRYLSQLFTSSILGYDISALSPKYIDIGYFTQPKTIKDGVEQTKFDEYDKNGNPYVDLSSFVSMMSNEQGLTGKSFTVNQETEWWMPKLNSLIFKNKFLSRAILQRNDGRIKSNISVVLRNAGRNIIAYVITDHKYIDKHLEEFEDKDENFEEIPKPYEEGINPKEKGWYIKDGDSHILTTDTKADETKTYYKYLDKSDYGLFGDANNLIVTWRMELINVSDEVTDKTTGDAVVEESSTQTTEPESNGGND